MKCKALLAALAGAAVLVTLAACGRGPAEAATTTPSPSEATSPASATTSAAAPNPIVTVDGPDAFQDELGLYLAADDLGSDPVYVIIGGTLAQVTYTAEVSGTTAEITVRNEKSAEAKNISGDYNTYATVEPGEAVGDIIPTLSFTEGEAGYATWYNPTSGVAGSVSVDKGATFDALNALAGFYINQGARGE